MALCYATEPAAVGGWDTSSPDWQERLRTGRSLVPDLPRDPVEGDYALQAFKALRKADVSSVDVICEVETRCPDPI
jgi:hypothetical protein